MFHGPYFFLRNIIPSFGEILEAAQQQRSELNPDLILFTVNLRDSLDRREIYLKVFKFFLPFHTIHRISHIISELPFICWDTPYGWLENTYVKKDFWMILIFWYRDFLLYLEPAFGIESLATRRGRNAKRNAIKNRNRFEPVREGFSVPTPLVFWVQCQRLKYVVRPKFIEPPIIWVKSLELILRFKGARHHTST